jgi:hypothetical protein
MARTHRQAASADEDIGAERRSPWRAFVIGAVAVVVVVVVILWTFRAFLAPSLEANSQATRELATAQAQVVAVQTRQALAPPVATAPAPTPVSAAAAPTAVATAVSTAAPATPLLTAAPNPAPTLRPTVPPALDAEVSRAYLRYFQVSADALLALDPTGLDEVAANGELEALQKDIEADRAQGRALRSSVQHEFLVLSAEGDSAQVADRYRDSSIYVDPATRQPLPGQVAPASPDKAPEVRVIYTLRRIDGVWKVVGGERYE